MDVIESNLSGGGPDAKPEGPDDFSVGHSDDEGDPGERLVAGNLQLTSQGTSGLQYQLRADTTSPGNSIAYKVVQMGSDGQLGISSISSVPEPAPSTQVAYIPMGNLGDGSGAAGAAALEPQSSMSSLGSSAGQLYVMMSPQDVLNSQRSIAPRTPFTPKAETVTRTARDERRRATHNEVERRRRDKINNWIVQLSKIVPECSLDGKTTQVSQQSKGGILSKTCEYIQELRNANARMAETIKEVDRLSVDTELLRQQVEELKGENSFLRSQLSQHGTVVPDFTDSTS